jgi:arylsulfatase A-like enzyme
MKKILLCLITCIYAFTFNACKDDTNCCDPVDSEHPNILLIIADDFGKDACIGYSQGAQKPNMPTLQSLINSGIRFENFWVHPLCTPTRSSLLTGKYPFRNSMLEVGNVLDVGEKSVFQFIEEKVPGKYATALIGKWHVGTDVSHPTQLGVPHYSGLLSGGVKSYTNWKWTHDGTTETETQYTTSKFTDMAIEWVAEQSKPWFLWLAFNAPHTPFHLPPADLHSQTGLSGTEADISANPLPYFMASIEAMDTEIGRLLGSMSDAEKENTYIIFIGDNGTPQQVAQSPYSKTKSKNSLYLGGINTPMIISGPSITSASVNSANFIQSTDILTTIAQICGSTTDEYEDSKSFYPILNGESHASREYLYGEIGGGNLAGHSLRNDSFKLIQYDNNTELFFNLASDVEENTNLNDQTLSPEATTNQAELKAELARIRN